MIEHELFTAIDHLGIASQSLDEAMALYQGIFGLQVVLRDILPDQGVSVVMLRCGGSFVELLAPTAPDSSLVEFLARRGPGIHHVAYAVADLPAALERCRMAGLQLIDEQPRIGAGGVPVAFLHPRGTGYALIELVERSTP